MTATWADTGTVVIGGGAAGLAAAYELSSHDHPCTLLEARARLGGRIFTNTTTATAIPMELGAEFIHGESTALFNWLRESRRVAVDASRERWISQRGRLRRAEDGFDELKRRFGRLPDQEPDISFAEFLHRHRRSLPQPVRERACAMVEGFDAADINRISAREVRAEWSGPAAADAPTFRPSHGYDDLLQAIRSRLRPDRATLRLCTIVRSLDWRKDRVDIEAVHFGKPVLIKARRAIVTLPLGVLQLPASAPGCVQFSPTLLRKKKALAHLASGPVVKVILNFARPFWAEMNKCRYRDAAFFFAPRTTFPTFWTSLPMRTSTLVAWSAGPNAERLTGRGENEILAEVLTSLRTLFGRQDYLSLLKNVAWHDWQSDPYARGAYSYVRTAGSRARQALAAPLDDTLFFAGEACDTQGEAGTVGGALRSGAVAARQVLKCAGADRSRSTAGRRPGR